jgi:signal transduction histidine kinase
MLAGGRARLAPALTKSGIEADTRVTSAIKGQCDAASGSSAHNLHRALVVLNHLGLGEYIADTISEPLLVVDAGFQVVAVNRAYFANFRTTPEVTVERGLFELGNGQWDIPELRRLLKEVLPLHREIEGFPVEHVFPELGARYMLINACEILRPAEHEYLILLAIEDITERRAAELALAVRTRELERSNRELEQFAAIASHDLHEPLRKIRTYCDLLLQAPDALPTAQGREQVDRMVHAATRMQTLINELLALARLAAPQRMVRIDAGAIVRDVLVDLESAIAAAGAVVTVGVLPVLLGDPTQLRQLLQNLISNSLKFRRADVAPSITVSTLESPAESTVACPLAGLCVADNGIGFEARHAQVIFEPLERLHGRSEYPGSGMGLALARRIVERHGGTISAEGVFGEGSRFCFTLPCPPPLRPSFTPTAIERVA